MKKLIVYVSVHHNNTEKIARIFANILEADMKNPEQIDSNSLLGYDLIGFGSGIYFFKHHKSLLEFAKRLPPSKNKKAIVFSTSGLTKIKFLVRHGPLKTILESKGFEVIGEFNCAGFDTVGPLRLIGGIKKGRPNDEDFKKAETFAKNLKRNINESRE
jgi:flavodoxin